MQDNVEILPVVSDDIPALGNILFQSKLHLTINRLLWKDWPNEVAQRQQYTSTVEGALNDATFETFKVVESSAQKIVGYMAMARKQPSGAPSKDEEVSEAQGLSDAINKDVCEVVYEAADSISDEWKNTDHYELVFIVVEQPYRRKGIGTELMRRCFAKATEASIPLVAYSEPAAYGFLTKLGFRDTVHADMDLTKWAAPFSGFGIFRLSGMVWRSDK